MENTKKVEEVGTESKAKKVEKPKKSTKKTTNETEVKQTEIKLDFVKLCQEKNARHKREEKAKEYSELVKRSREQRKRKIFKAMETVVIVLTFVIVAAIVIQDKSNVEAETQGNTYTMQGELQGNHVVLEDGNCHEVSKEYANYTSKTKEVTVTLNDNGTEEVKDDVVVDIR